MKPCVFHAGEIIIEVMRGFYTDEREKEVIVKFWGHDGSNKPNYIRSYFKQVDWDLIDSKVREYLNAPHTS